MDYYQDLNRDDFASTEDYLAERVKRGLAAGFTVPTVPTAPRH